PSRGPFVVIEEPTEPRPNPPPGRPVPVIDERVVQPLMIPLVMLEAMAEVRPRLVLLVQAAQRSALPLQSRCRAGTPKTGRSGLLPMSARLAAVLDMAKLDPASREYPPSAYVFGDLGARIVNFSKALETAVLRAH